MPAPTQIAQSPQPPWTPSQSKAIDGAAQILLNVLGAEVTVDGDFGPASVTEMQRVLGPLGIDAAQATPTDRLLALARGYWQNEPCRTDLY